ncbi:DUF2897 family protein [Vibrio sp. 99-70-13A1]|uniref:DUF2897 family protein n=1 Tax=Vibrio sp. 99-70-13A1 TaxID=2607601 RepID=UPI001493C1D6|nr:DUF2897 family protein [Vibrio sp. 99-70-13A1]NOH98451.1 DUF2897 family protein [Vibrio sp. 99-70-13A1]
MLEILTNPWVICFIVVSVIVGNIAALKYTANMNVGKPSRLKGESDLDKLNRLDKLNSAKKAAEQDTHKDA